MISKLLRLYKRTYGLRQICNIAVYIAHSACTIHLLNLPDKDARRDIAHGVRQLEEIAESWLCARRTLVILALQVRKWGIELPEEASSVLSRAELKYGTPLSPASRSDTMLSGKESPEAQQTVRINNQMAQAIVKSANAQSPVALSTGVAGRRQQKTSNPASPPTDAAIAQSNRPSPVQYPEKGSASQDSSPTNIFGGSEPIFEDSKDWWLKDQSSLFDNWSRRESYPTGYPVGANVATQGMNGTMNSMTVNDLGIFNMSGSNDMGIGNGMMDELSEPEAMNGVPGIKRNGVNDLTYLDFGQAGGQYGYNGSDVY